MKTLTKPTIRNRIAQAVWAFFHPEVVAFYREVKKYDDRTSKGDDAPDHISYEDLAKKGVDERIAADYGIPAPTGNPGEVLQAFGGFVKVDNRATPDAPSIGEVTAKTGDLNHGMTDHQMRAAAIDWSASPAWATHYVIRYAPYLDGPKTLAAWGDGAGEKTEDAKAYFKLREDERNKPIVFSFGESQAAKQLLHQLQQMDRVGELPAAERRAQDQSERA